MKKYARSLLSLALSLVLLVETIPLQAIAANLDLSASDNVEMVAATTQDFEESEILGEIISEREEYVKRFRMSDGTIQAVQYDVPVHYFEDGQWVEYNKSLSEDDALEEDTLLGEIVEETEDTEFSEVPGEEITAKDPVVEMLEDSATVEAVSADSGLSEDPVEEPVETPPAEQSTDEVPEETAIAEASTTAEESSVEEMPAEEPATDATETDGETTEDIEVDIETSEAETVEEDTSVETPTEESTEGAVAEVPVEEAAAAESTEVSVKEWINLSPDFSVRFSKKTNGNKFVRVEADGHALAWAFSDANKVDGVVVEAEESDDPRILSNVRGAVLYPDAFGNADLEYVLQPGSLKENIILQNADAANVFTIAYKYNTLTAVQVDDQTVEFQDANGQAVYILYAPYMTDANGEASNALTLEITKNKKNSCTITLTADKTWLSDENRAYPVTVDPLLVTSQAWDSETPMESCFISSANPNTCYGGYGSMYAGYYNYGGDNYGSMRSLVKVSTLPELGVGDKVVHAEFAAHVIRAYPVNTITVHRVLTNWSQSTATWNSGIIYEDLTRDYQIVPQIEYGEAGVNRWECFEITDLVRGWYSGDYPNYGFMLRSNYENTSGTRHVQFHSFGAVSYPTTRPMLLIYYRNMTGYEDYWSYTNVAAGRNGTASVNNYNGNLSFVQPLTQDAGGTLMPVNLSAVYNSTATVGCTMMCDR